ncbi:hypothetical protein D3C80_1286470 [compost metagenome]
MLHLGDNRLLDLSELFGLHLAQFLFRLREESLVTLPQIRRLFIVALQQEAQAPLTAHAHGESKYRIAKLLFGTQLTVEPRLNNLPQHRAVRRTGKLIVTRWDKDSGQRRVRAAACFLKDHILLFLNKHILITAPLVTVSTQLFANILRERFRLFFAHVPDNQKLWA